VCEPRKTGVRRRARASERRDGKRRGFDCTRSGGECAEWAAADEFALVKTLKRGWTAQLDTREGERGRAEGGTRAAVFG